MMKIHGLCGAVSAIATLAIAAPALATTFVNGTVNARVQARVNGIVDTFEDHTGLVSTALPATISATGFSSANSPPFTGSAGAIVRAEWVSANEGVVVIDWNWFVNATGATGPTSVRTNIAMPNWSYTFVASSSGAFVGTYDVSALGDLAGLNPILGLEDMPAGPYGGDAINPSGSGTFSVPLVAGQTYTMAFANNGGFFSDSGGFTQNSAGAAVIEWYIVYAPVPEPATWAMLIAGFGIVGSAVRRRQTMATQA